MPKKKTISARKSIRLPDDYSGETALPNVRWEAFCQYYTGEYRRNAAGAYVASGYHSKTTASSSATAHKLLNNAYIKKRVAFLENEALERIRLSRLDAVNVMTQIAFVTYSDFLDDEGKVDISKVRDPSLAHAVKKCRALRDMNGLIYDYDLELYDKVKNGLDPLGMTENQNDASSQNNQVLVIKV